MDDQGHAWVVGVLAACLMLGGLGSITWGLARLGVRTGVRACWSAAGFALLTYGLFCVAEVSSPGTLSRLALMLVIGVPALSVLVGLIAVVQLRALQRRVLDFTPDSRPPWIERYFGSSAPTESRDRR